MGPPRGQRDQGACGWSAPPVSGVRHGVQVRHDLTPDCPGVVEVITAFGGTAARGALVAATSRRHVRAAIGAGEVVRIAHGRYALPVVEEADTWVHRAGGVLGLASAALCRGWEVKRVPDKPQVVVPKHRRLRPEVAEAVEPTWVDLDPGDRDDVAGTPVTAAVRTLEMCLRRMPFDEAVVVADSALRHGVPPEELAALASRVRGPGSAQVRRVATIADARSANVFESTLKAIAADVPGLHARPQVTLRGSAIWMEVCPDPVDTELGVVLEADSFEWHGKRRALLRDCRRYNALVVNGWTVLRFPWEDVMFNPDLVRRTLVAVVALRRAGCA